MNSPAAFTMVMTKVLSTLLFKFVLCYIDDVLTYSANFEKHLTHLKFIFDPVSVSAKKTVKYLGHTPDSILPSDRRWPNVSTFVGPTLAADVGPTAF